MLNIEKVANTKLAERPYRWAEVNDLFSKEDASALASTYPRDHLKRIARTGGEKDYDYLARSLVHMGSDELSFPEVLSPAWKRLAEELLSPEYRLAMGKVSGIDLAEAPLEINVMHYNVGSHLGPHVDHPSKFLTQVFYFNESWRFEDGGCINILRSKDSKDVEAAVLPVVGNSVILHRCDHSWHSVIPVASGVKESRRSMNVIFHLAGSISTMWPPGKEEKLFSYEELAA